MGLDDEEGLAKVLNCTQPITRENKYRLTYRAPQITTHYRRVHRNVMTRYTDIQLTNNPSYSTNKLSQRSQLFPEDRYDGSRSASPSQRAAQGYNNSSNRFDSAVMDSLESQNDEAIEGLSAKVRLLKNVPSLTGAQVVGYSEDW
jgi:hypothetical protein